MCAKVDSGCAYSLDSALLLGKNVSGNLHFSVGLADPVVLKKTYRRKAA
jgi:hypothetical protein